MQRFEFKVIPAPKRGEKARGVKTTEDRFALALTNLMNELGAEGWDYVRADALPCEERSGFTSTKTTFQNVLVFRRAIPSLSAEAPASTRLLLQDSEPPAPPRLGPADTPPPGNAPSLGPAKLAAE
ncbi:DUF4177 domain-containing protein [Planktothrix agardhii 1811]|uniref:DUF4177 domain-containing protein n=1 Tax=Planktothrix agardhii TaxID=1160 RepID=UPI001F482A88|nr:DUF4177 domain-containing protein [Planktothrix agardhii]MCF3581107.1 DUF4177 domain-containing protein [Planktothrix agardhii 1811]